MMKQTYLLPLLATLWLAGCGSSNNPLVPQVRPVDGGFISSAFGPRDQHPVLGYVPGRHHDGDDFAVAAGSPVHASMAGKVTFAGWRGGYGNAVIVEHADGYSTLYGHAASLLVKEGEHVSQGETIALVGSTGLSTGPHLHYELRHDGVAVDPGGFGTEPLPEAVEASYTQVEAPRPVVRKVIPTFRAPLGLRGREAAVLPNRPAHFS